jgi:hypothetical protein
VVVVIITIVVGVVVVVTIITVVVVVPGILDIAVWEISRQSSPSVQLANGMTPTVLGLGRLVCCKRKHGDSF